MLLAELAPKCLLHVSSTCSTPFANSLYLATIVIMAGDNFKGVTKSSLEMFARSLVVIYEGDSEFRQGDNNLSINKNHQPCQQSNVENSCLRRKFTA